ncbi:MAG: ATP-binding protein, partial [Mycobacterium sp.]
VPDALTADIVMADNEANANRVEQAYRGQSPCKVRIESRYDGAHVQIRIADSGSWKAAPADCGNRGRGLMLIRAVSDWLELDCTPGGTTVDMTFRFLACATVPEGI